MNLSRRDFLKKSGVLSTGIVVSVSLVGCMPPFPTFADVTPEAARAWLRLSTEGEIQFISPRQEMGQGVSTGLKQIIAEELGVNPVQIKLTLFRTDQIDAVASTVGSQSILDFAEPVALAAACLRETILDRALKLSKLENAQLSMQDTGVSFDDGFLSFKEIAAGATIHLLGSDVSMRSEGIVLNTFSDAKKKFVGKPVVSDELHDIVTGAALFTADVQLDDMLYGGLARPPKLGSVMAGYDLEKAKNLTGIVSIIECLGTLGVVGETPMIVTRGIDALLIDWKIENEVSQESIDRSIDIDANDKKLEHKVMDEGDIQPGNWTVDQRYDIPMAAHMAIEPRCSVAHWQEDRIDVWASGQDIFMVRDAVGKYLDVRETSVIVHSNRIGGSFGGGSFWPDVEAAILSKAVKRPVKVQLSRPENFQLAYHRPPSSHRIRIRTDNNGYITDWWHRFKSGHVAFTSAIMPRWMQTASSVIGDFGVARGSDHPYGRATTNIKVEFSDIRMPVHTGPWRGLGAAPNCFAVESAVDAAAHASDMDPIVFRLKNIDDIRLKNCIEQVRKIANWKDGDSKLGRGIACGIYKQLSYAAIIVDIEIEKTTGKAVITHMYCAHDCGLVINPDQVRAQIEGNLVWSIGMVTKESLYVENGRINADYPGQYSLPLISDIPPMTIALIEEPGVAPSGAAESAIVGSAAISNALSGLLSQNYNKLPINLKTITSR